MKIQQIALNHLSDNEFRDLIKIYKKCAAEPYSFFVNDTTLLSDNPLTNNIKRIRNNSKRLSVVGYFRNK